jgi:hypothetical protein
MKTRTQIKAGPIYIKFEGVKGDVTAEGFDRIE